MFSKPKRKNDEVVSDNEKTLLFEIYRFLHLTLKQSITIEAAPSVCAEQLESLKSPSHHVVIHMHQIDDTYQFDISVETARHEMRRRVMGTIYPASSSTMSFITFRVYPSAFAPLVGSWILFLTLLQVSRMLPLMASSTYAMTRGDSVVLFMPFMLAFMYLFSYLEKREALRLVSDHLLQLNTGEE